MYHTIQIGCALEKLLCSRENDTRKTEKLTGTRVDFVEPQCRKQEMTPLLLINNSIGSRMTTTATKGGLSNSTRILRELGAHTSVTPDAMTWANTWELIKHDT